MKTKIRNLVLAVVLLLAFVGGGIVFYSVWVVQKPFAVIVFLVPQLDASTLAAARLYAGGSKARLEIESMPGVVLLRNTGTASTALEPLAVSRLLATGSPTRSSEESSENEQPLLQTAASQGRILGLVTNGRLTSPILAAFYAPNTDPADAEQTSVALLESVRPEVVLGGGADELLPDLVGGVRQDGRDLLLEARQSGYDIVRTLPELQNTPTWRAPRVFGVFAQGEMNAASGVETTGQPTLANMVASAIQLLQFQRRGYFLVVDCSRIASAANANQGENLLREILAMDEAVGTARQYAGKNSLLLVVGTTSTGGFVLNANASMRDSGLAVLNPSAAGVPSVTWSTGPGNAATTQTGIEEPVAFPIETATPNVTDMLGFWLGPEKATPPSGIHDNTLIPQLLREAL